MPLTKYDLLAAMRAGRKEWDDLLDRIPERLLERPGAVGDWAIRDVIARVACHEEYTEAFLCDFHNVSALGGFEVKALDRHFQEVLDRTRLVRPDFPAFLTDVSCEQLAEVFVAAFRDHPAAEVREHERKVYSQLIYEVGLLTEAVLQDRLLMNGQCLLEDLPNQTYLHYQVYMPAIQEWLEQQSVGV